MIRPALLVGAAALMAGVRALPAQPAGRPADAAPVALDTVIRSFDGRTLPAVLLRITVPERRVDPGRSITLSALRIPSLAERPGRPILFLMGGPGVPGSAMAPIPQYFTLFDRLRGFGDVVLVDQRGIGSSEPRLDCPLSGALPESAFVAPGQLVAMYRREVAACTSHWRGQGAEPTAWTTVESAADLDDLRRALGAGQVDLLAFSYGSRLALAYLDRYGSRVGRIVLQGVNGPGLALRSPAPVARKLRLLGERLARDTAWHAPTDLLAAARTARTRLAAAPAAVTVGDRRERRARELLVGRDGFDAIVGMSLDDARLPALLVSVAAGDDRLLAQFTESAWNGLAGGTVGLMPRAVNCAADRPRSRWDAVTAEAATAPFGAPFDLHFLTDEFCRAVGYATPPVEFDGPVRSQVPALLVTGELDATNPVENARAVARGLPNAVLVEVVNAAHEALPVPEVQDLVVDFFRGEDVGGRRVAASPPTFPSVQAALRAGPAPRR
ncbi:MAG: alpha/beta fold hydrolase [Gemmatimonadales bacterium]